MKSLYSLTLLCCWGLFQAAILPERPIMDTPYGSIRGKIFTNQFGHQVSTFLGIPFAAPPIGNLRFKHPISPEKWSGIKDTVEYSDICPQRRLNLAQKLPGARHWYHTTPHSEDCLYLNIFVPNGGTNSKPVMVYFHGGSFNSGSSAVPVYNATYLASSEDVIVVTVNYRVGLFGFINLNHSDVHLNCGLMDQLMALRWVRRGISNFGGDPSKVTIFGQSAGGMSVGLHLVSPLSKDLFLRAIMHGGAISDFIPAQDPKEGVKPTLQLADNFGCPLSNHSLIYDCLINGEMQELVDSAPPRGSSPATFGPVVDGIFLTEHPAKTLEKGDFVRKDIMLGINKNEGSLFLALHNPFLYSFVKDVVKPKEEELKTAAGLVASNQDHEPTLKAIVYEYTDWADRNNSESILRNLEHMINDPIFICPTVNTAKQFSSNGTGHVYAYYFVHRSPKSEWAKWMGVQHGGELVYAFGRVLKENSHYTEVDKEFSKTVMRYLGNFARTGDPNQSPKRSSEVQVTLWPNFTLENQRFLVLAPSSTSIIRNLRAKKCQFWEKYIPYIKSLKK